MKHLIWGCLLCSAVSATAQKVKPAAVPQEVKASFSRLYPAVQKVTWEKEKGNYEAGFKQDGNSISVVFDAKGASLETEKEIRVSDLPAPVRSYIRDHYKS